VLFLINFQLLGFDQLIPIAVKWYFFISSLRPGFPSFGSSGLKQCSITVGGKSDQPEGCDQCRPAGNV